MEEGGREEGGGGGWVCEERRGEGGRVLLPLLMERVRRRLWAWPPWGCGRGLGGVGEGRCAGAVV